MRMSHLKTGRTITHRIGRRGSCLLFFTFLDLVYGINLIYPPAFVNRDPTVRYLTSILPLSVWGTLWTLVGLICFVSAFLRYDAAGFAAAIFLKIVWGTFVGLAWLFNGAPRGYVSAAIWIAFAGFICVLSGWTEPPSPDPPTHD